MHPVHTRANGESFYLRSAPPPAPLPLPAPVLMLLAGLGGLGLVKRRRVA